MHSPFSIPRVTIHVLSLRYINHGCFRELLVGVAIGNVYVLFIGVVNSMGIWTAHVGFTTMLLIHVVLIFTNRTAGNVDTNIEVNIVTVVIVFHIIHPFIPLVAGLSFKFRSLLVVHESLSVSPSYCTNDIFFTNF